jgi:transcriptional regulator with XRE-family HTH domain
VAKPSPNHRERQDPEGDASLDAAALSLGREIRLVRQQKALSMQTLADAAGLSRAWLGEIERGAASPSVDIVRRLANALGVSIGSLLDGRAPAEERESHQITPSREVHLVPRDKRVVVRFPSQPFFWELITPLRGELQVMMADLVPTDAPLEMMEHGGQELVLVLEGEIEVRVAGQTYSLQPGDAITFSAQLPHGFGNRGPREAKMLNATAPPSIGERWH